MDMMEAIRVRHSVRKYRNQPIEAEKVEALNKALEEINAETGFNFQMFLEEPEAFNANAPHYGQFSGCRNYFALVAPKGRDEEVGYYGEMLVLLAQTLGLNTCWVALTYRKGKVNVNTAAGEKMYMVIALGYGETQGNPRRSRPMEALCDLRPDTPEWFKNGMEAAMLAPTAVNQQKFYFTEKDGEVHCRAKLGFYNKVDLGIVKLHFEIGSGKKVKG